MGYQGLMNFSLPTQSIRCPNLPAAPPPKFPSSVPFPLSSHLVVGCAYVVEAARTWSAATCWTAGAHPAPPSSPWRGHATPLHRARLLCIASARNRRLRSQLRRGSMLLMVAAVAGSRRKSEARRRIVDTRDRRWAHRHTL
jgi:hypothetical protein